MMRFQPTAMLLLASAGVDAITHPLVARTHGRTLARATNPHMGILKNIDPLLTADLLYALRSAGHGDVIAVVDANFPATSTAATCVIDEPIVLAGVDCVEGMAAIGSVLPLDRFVDCPVGKMVPSEGSELPVLGSEVHEKAIAALGDSFGVQEVERFDFYSLAEDSFAIVQCAGERRPFGCFLLTKGVVGPDGKDLMP
uniref:L-fucose mutarotase n=1 Tax=Haptolina brevifila TaxID=156173 RepID=A0A7S2J3J1_9EUKA